MSNFVWGSATSAFQIEGGLETFGRSPSIWDDYLNNHGYRGDNGSVASDHLNRFPEDIDLAAALGVDAYRFSISWSRVMPEPGYISSEGVDFYRRVLDEIHRHGLRPIVQLYHMDLPTYCLTYGGWAGRETTQLFGEYVDAVMSKLGDHAGDWLTVNELYYESWLGYGTGAFPPAFAESRLAVAALHHMLLAHGMGQDIIRSHSSSHHVGLVVGYAPVRPIEHTEQCAELAKTVHEHTNAVVLDPVFFGHYPSSYTSHPARAEELDAIVRSGDMETIQGIPDILGMNYYFGRDVIASSGDSHRAIPDGWQPAPAWLDLPHLEDLGARQLAPLGAEATMAGWAPDPQGLADALGQIGRDYPVRDLWVTENGLPLPDYRGTDGEVDDVERIEFLSQHIDQVRQARESGVPVSGYFAWSLLDNLEWTEGFRNRFGLVYVDFFTQERVPKKSFYWYQRFLHEVRNAQ
jgi:beta-glucosidase